MNGYVYFHLGIRANAYYLAKADFDSAVLDAEDVRLERDVHKKLLGNVHENIAAIDFDVDIDSYRTEVSELLELCGASLEHPEHKLARRRPDVAEITRRGLASPV